MHDGIEFSTDGHWYSLKSDHLGGYEQTINPGTFGTYAVRSSSVHELVSPADATPSKTVVPHLVELNLDLMVSFEVDPKRFEAQDQTTVWYVPQDPTTVDPAPATRKNGEYCDASSPCQAGLRCSQLTVSGGTIGMCGP
jgi:hypothetical protein